MRVKLIFLIFVISLVAIYGCAQPVEKTPLKQELSESNTIPEDKDTTVEAQEKDPEISAEITGLLDIANKKVKSIRYKYKGPETNDFFYEFSVKDNMIKYTIDPTFKIIDAYDDAYDTIYIDQGPKTALAYCDSRKCKVKGKKSALDYDETYISTPFDWLNNIGSAEKTGEELIDQRNTWKLSTDAGTVWVDTFFGVPLQAEFKGNIHKFAKMIFNDIEDNDVMPG